MKKRFLLIVLILVLNGCGVQKKQLYVFSHYGYITKADGTLKMPGEIIHSNLTSVHKNDTINTQPVIDNAASPIQREVRLLKQPKLHPRRIDRVINEQSIDSRTETYEVEKFQPVEKTRHRKSGDRLLYLVASLMGLAVMGLTRLLRPAVTTITRWAKANPRTTQGVIAGIHLPLLGLGILNGHNLYQMGYDTSDAMLYTFGAATALGFLSTPFMPKHDIIAMPRKVNLQRLSFAALTISSLMMMVGLGNRIERNYPNSTVAQTVRSIDQSVFYASDTQSVDPNMNLQSPSKIQQDRPKAAGISGFAAGLSIFFLTLLACAGICLIIGGIAGIASATVGAIAAIVGGAGVFYLAVKGIGNVSRKRRQTKEQEIKQGL